MRLRTIAIAATVVVVGLVATAFAILASMDFNTYRGLIAEKAKAATGRDLAIKGDLKLALSLTPALAVEDVTFANAAWGSRPEMVRVKRLEVQVQVLPLLLSRTIKVDRLVLIGPDIVLETDANGRGNWEFQEAKAPGAPAPSPAPGEPSTPQALPEVHEVMIKDGSLVFRDGKAKTSHKLEIASLTVEADGPGDPMRVNFDGTVDARKVQVAATLGSLDTLQRPGTPFPVKLEAKAAEATFRVDGAIRELLRGQGYDVVLAAEGPELARLAELGGTKMPPFGPFKVSLRASDTAPNNGPEIKDIKAELGKKALVLVKLDGGVADVLGRKGIAFNLSAEGDEIGAWSGFNIGDKSAPIGPVPALGPYRVTLRVAEANGRPGIPAFTLQLGRPDLLKLEADGSIVDPLGATRLALNVKAESAEASALSRLVPAGTGPVPQNLPAIGPLRFEARVEGNPENPAIPRLKLELGRAETVKLDVAGSVKNARMPDGLAITVALSAPDPRALSALVGQEVPVPGPLSFSTKLADAGLGRYALNDIRLKAGDNDLSGKAALKVGTYPEITADLSSTQFDVAAFAAPQAAAGGGRPGPAPKPADGRVFSDEPLPYDLIAKVDGEIKYRAQKLRAQGTTIANLALQARFKNGEMALRPLTADIGGGKLAVDLTVNGKAQTVAGKIDAKGINLGPFLREMQVTNLLGGGKTDSTVEFRGTGRSLRAVMASLSGTSTLLVGEGDIGNDYVDLLGGDVVRVLSAFQDSRARTSLNCAVSRFEIQNGVATSRVFTIDTGRMTVEGGGTVNLGNETLAMMAMPRPKDASLLSVAIPIRIGGTLAQPSFKPDASAAAKDAATAAIGTLLLGPVGALAPLVSGGQRGADPCAQARAAATGQRPPAQPAQPGATQQRPQGQQPGAAPGLGQGLERGLRGILGR